MAARTGLGGLVLAAALTLAPAALAQRPPTKFAGATTSSPITVSADGKVVWAVNPKADTVSVLAAGSNKLLRTIKVGREPRAVALDPANRYAYVVNAASSNVSVIRISSARVSRYRASVIAGLTTGAEPWNI